MYYRRWTIAAVYCYKRGCVCNGCYYAENLETRCVMKKSVIELVRILKKPKFNLKEGEK